MRTKANRIAWLLLLVLGHWPLKTAAKTDSSLYLGDLLQWVGREHPLAKSAQLQIEWGSSALQASRGAFDPVISLQQFSKDFAGKQYYDAQQWSIQGYTRWAIGWESGFEQMLGQEINPAESTPNGGLYYQGISLPLLRDLSTDYRRTAFQKAQLLNSATQWEQRLQVNALLAEVCMDYIDWTQAHLQRIQAEQALSLSLNRLSAMRELFAQGACNGLDTLEVYAQYAAYKVKFEETSYKEIAGRYWVSRHLWDNGNPVALRADVVPNPDHMQALDRWCQSIRSHIQSDSQWLTQTPQYQLAHYKISSKELEARLWRNQRLPQLQVKYQWLQSSWSALPQSLYDDQNQRFGLYFQSPLFLRSAQGNMQMAQTEQAQLSLSWEQKQRDLEAKQESLWEAVLRSSDMFKWQTEQTQTLGTLYEGELEKFKAGDAQFFVLNTRESRYIQGGLDLWETWAYLRQSQVEYLFQTGLLHSLP